MRKNILWKGKAYNSLESCFLTTTKDGTEISSVIIGCYNEIIYEVEYFIKTNKNWETVFFEIKSNLNGVTQSFTFKKEDNSDTLVIDKKMAPFDGYSDVDISLTPLTNTLPINRLLIKQKEMQKIDVLYIDILNHQIRPVQQNYTRLSKYKYKFEHVPNDFQALITVDEYGLVVDYPELFERLAEN